ncbi:Coatomer subunit beta [Echinococcus multilocularis]|uniref:Beta'-coat protein n=1 Tax=Echinococcus multilocularis TaxID=6211 RepID=A0A087W284_ECHMU|nr:Coatomer subunit beta [Echinococcus multilocularis]
MPLRLDVRKKLSSRSDRVKAVDLHPTEPWICACLYNGNVHVWNIESQQLIKTFEVCPVPVRAVRFVARMNWIVTGADNQCLTVYNYNTLERVHQQVEAHGDYIRSIVVHPTQPLILTCSDDVTIRLWDWEKNWKCAQIFSGHSHYVMQLMINPKDNNTFASASLDCTVKVWSLGSPQANFTLEGHEKGVNCVDYHPSPDKPYLASGSDDHTVRIWDYQTKLCVQVLEGHVQNVTALAFHTELPVILTGSEDDTVRVWHSTTYRLESTLNYGLGRVWTVQCRGVGGRQTVVGVGYDEGTVVIALGREHPAVSMDASGKLVCARHSEMVNANLRSVIAAAMASGGGGGAPGATEGTGGEGGIIEDGARLPVVYKEMGASEIFPHTVAHNANGRFLAVCGDGEYIVYTAMALRNRTFGSALEFVWSQADPNVYAVLESNSTFKIFRNFKEVRSVKMDFAADQVFGGHLLGVRSVAGFTFYDWSTGLLVRRIDVTPVSVHWSENGNHVAICTKDTFYILRYQPEVIAEAMLQGITGPDGVEAAFELIPDGEVKESVKTGCWFGEAFLFTNSTNRLQYYVGGELVSVAHLDQPMYLLGYLASENRVFLINRDLKVVSYTLSLSVLEYESAVLRGDFESADAILPNVPTAARTKVAHFLERQGFKRQAMQVTVDPEHKFDLAIQLDDVTTAYDLIKEEDVEGNEAKWKQLAEVALKACNFSLAQECFAKTQDYASFLLIATSRGDIDMMQKLASDASAAQVDNLAFLAYFLLGNLEACFELLLKSEKYPEAAFFARTYMPSKVPDAVEKWRKWLEVSHPKAAEALANPSQYPNLFPHWEGCLAAEKWLAEDHKKRRNLPATAYPQQTPLWERKIAEEMLSSKPLSADLLDIQKEVKLMGTPPHDPIEELFGTQDTGRESDKGGFTPFRDFNEPKELIPEFLEASEVKEEERDVFAPLKPPAPAVESKSDPINDLLKLSQAHTEENVPNDVEKEEDEEQEEPFHDAGQQGNVMDLFASPPTAGNHPLGLDDFDVELEQQLSAFNIGASEGVQKPTSVKKDLLDDNGWGDEDDDSDGIEEGDGGDHN